MSFLSIEGLPKIIKCLGDFKTRRGARGKEAAAIVAAFSYFANGQVTLTKWDWQNRLCNLKRLSLRPHFNRK